MSNLSSLNEEQMQAVTHGEGPLLIIAGAGTGKTTVVTKRIEHLILDKNISPSNILALTFTEKAASEMESRIDEILPYGYTTMWLETFHAFCDRILRAEAINIGLTPNFKLQSEAESILFLRKRLFQFDLDYFRPLGNPTKFIQGMLTHFNRLKDDDISPEQYLEFANSLSFRAEPRNLIPQKRTSSTVVGDPSTRSSVGMTNKENPEDDELKKILELANAFKKYEELKAQEGVMDYSDLISNVLKLFRTRPHILKQYQNLFAYVFVDEFQDTNYAQNEMAILLAGKKQNITVVGDDDQSIYRWRGAAISNMIQFRTHFPKTKIITLTKNYRSTQTILDSAYQLIQHNNPDRLEVKENIDKKLKAMLGISGEPAEFIFTNRAEDEAEAVAKKIKDEVKKSNRPYNEFAILVRANDHATPFLRALERMKIPSQFLGPEHLFQQEEIKDLIAYLHALANFEDSASLYRVLTMPIFALEARDIAALLNYSKRLNISLFEAMELAEQAALTQDGKDKVARITQILKDHLSKIPTENAGQILYYFFEDSGLLGHYLDPRSPRTEKEAANVAKFFDKLNSFAANKRDASIFAVVDWIDLAMDLGESPLATEIDWTRNNAVNILTVHSSKGLEFPFVFVVNLVAQRFPSRDRKEQIPLPPQLIKETLPEGDESLQEERRLFYVAITRAKEKLYLAASRFYGDAKREKKLSPFIAETLGGSYVDAIIKKQTFQDSTQQLSLLDIFNANIASQEETKNQVPTANSQPLTPITYISYSQLQTYQMCPLHYKLRYIMNVPTPTTSALSYGVSIHSVLRDYVQGLQAKQEISISELLKKNWSPLGYENKDHERQAYKQAEIMLARFASDVLAEKPNTIAIELPFNFWLAPPKPGEGGLDKTLKVGGRIDRIDRLPDGRIEIIDYKTGTNTPTEKKVKEDFQLSFYALAATEIHDNLLNKTPDELVLTLHYVEANQKFSTTRTKDELEIAKLKILTLVDEISKSDFHCTRGIFCKNCEYKMVCGRN